MDRQHLDETPHVQNIPAHNAFPRIHILSVHGLTNNSRPGHPFRFKNTHAIIFFSHLAMNRQPITMHKFISHCAERASPLDYIQKRN